MIDTIIIVIFGIIMIVFAALAVNSKKIVHSAVWLIVTNITRNRLSNM